MARIPASALVLGLAGLVPFAVASLAPLTGSPIAEVAAPDVFLIYAAVILSFLGGVRWGVEMARNAEDPSGAILFLSIMPSILAWGVAFYAMTFSEYGAGGFAFAFLFGLQLFWDLGFKEPVWYRNLRTILSIGAIGFCIAFVLVAERTGAGN
jgi:hypothetical protein